MYRRFLGYIRPYWALFLLSIMGFILGSGAEAYFVSIFGDFIDGWGKEPVGTVRYIPVMLLGLAVARAVGDIVGEMLLSQISFSVVHHLRTQLFDQLLMMPSAYFDASSQGHLVSRLTYNVAQLRDTGTDALKSIIQDGAKVIIFLGWMLWISWELTLLFAVISPVVGLVVVYASRRFRRISRRIQLSMGDVTHVASETVSGYRVVRIFGGERYESRRFRKASQVNRVQNLKMVATKVASTQIIQIFVVATISLLILLLSQPQIAGELSVGSIVTFLGLAAMLVRPIQKLSNVNARLQRGLAAAEDIFGQMDQPAEDDQGTVDVERVTGRIEFKNVGFTYQQGSSAVFKSLNLTIEPGQTVALVGKSGSGKSTLVSMIPRFYEPDSGEILLDGVPVSSYRLEALRRQIALVTQEVTLFNDTLERNIAYGGLVDAGVVQLRDALERAHAGPFIDKLPHGLETMVGDDGVLLSGGQRQRVAIARALLKDAPILILDEATSALDTESERHIQAALEEVMRNRTTLVIAHRLSTIENADLILVMENGRIVESGQHQELLDRQGSYASLYNAQFEEESPEVEVPVVSRTAVVKPARYVESTFSPLARAWYSGAGWTRWLAPLSWIFARIAARRRWAYLTGKKSPWRAEVPVLVVGNITAGGTGKTPLVIWLVEWLKTRGYSPGIVSSGYGGDGNRSPLLVGPDDDPETVGDEAPILARRAGCPVVIGKNRVAATRFLLEHHNPDIVVCDDGLQHYALARDLEIVVLDGHRGIGNGRHLPAGPLREPVSRLAEVDWVISNGRATGLAEDETVMRVVPVAFVKIDPGREESPYTDGGERLSWEDFTGRFHNVHAIAGVGNPTRFAHTLRELGLAPLLHGYGDHHRFDGSEFKFENEWPVVCTEKDAVKISRLAEIPDNCWYLEIDVELPADSSKRLSGLLRKHGIGH
ncbi:MAG: lipid A export permease/ATP-binding protein MsbA [Gammaproteobacteria bacterium]|nr:lipid A export permease/ATP-binding protein MsbA [Gammaproteobacteria bacterium]